MVGRQVGRQAVKAPILQDLPTIIQVTTCKTRRRDATPDHLCMSLLENASESAAQLQLAGEDCISSAAGEFVGSQPRFNFKSSPLLPISQPPSGMSVGGQVSIRALSSNSQSSNPSVLPFLPHCTIRASGFLNKALEQPSLIMLFRRI